VKKFYSLCLSSSLLLSGEILKINKNKGQQKKKEKKKKKKI